MLSNKDLERPLYFLTPQTSGDKLSSSKSNSLLKGGTKK
jgi:hypothetical protein